MASANADAIRATKRKLDQAFLVLDAAVSSPDPADNPPPKRIHTSGSLYSTLAKYGIKFNSKTQPHYPAVHLSNNTPHLSAILSRAASRIRTTPPFRLGNQSSPPTTTAEYRPSSISSFLSRLATFKLSTYSNKPVAIDAVAASKCGWTNDGKDRLVCVLCKGSWVVLGREGMTREAANALLVKQRLSLVDAHKDGCPWKRRQCDDSIYCVPLQTPAVMVRELKQNANLLDPLLDGIIIKHPLTMKNLESLYAVIASFSPASPFEPHLQEGHSASRSISPSPEDGEPSHNGVLTALFGWSIIPSATLGTSSSQKTSPSRASSVTPSATPPRTLSISRDLRSPYPISTPASISMLSLNGTKSFSRENALLYCPLCQRRVGLWAFAPQSKDPEASSTISEASINTSVARQRPQRPFDLVKEHRSFCPYVVRSTMVPSLPISPSATVVDQSNAIGHGRTLSSGSLSGSNGGNLEGWRAVLTTILRYGMKQRLACVPLRSETTDGALDNEPMEVDAVKVMVNGVKNRGGRDLLTYVRNLLG